MTAGTMYKLVLLVFFMRCLNTLASGNHAEENTATVISSSNIASNDFYQVLAKENGNVLFCPLSLNILLALITTSAGGKTAEELRTALHLKIENKDIESGYKNVLHNLKDESLKTATKVFPNISASILPSFIKRARRFFNSGVQKVNYTEPRKAAKIINTFAEKNTNNKIHDLVNEHSFDKNTLLLLVNAVHFKDDWKIPFEYSFDDNFYLSKNQKVNTKMMEHTGSYKYNEIASLDARVLKIPFTKKGYSMLIILPNEIDGLQDVEKKLKLINFEEIYNNLTRNYVKLTMPNFKMEKEMQLVNVCKQLGIQKMFQPFKANLSGIAKLSNGTIYVSDIIQKSFIQVDEKGVEAAFATEIDVQFMTNSAPMKINNTDPIVFKADHPFIFVLMKYEMVLFLGRLSQI